MTAAETNSLNDFRAVLPGGVTIFVPDSLENLTTFSLRERGDWFADELRWLRGTFGAGLHALDIGANYGCYALSLAALAGPGGRVWAYEPDPDCCVRLQRSAAANGFSWLAVREAALADQPGRATFSSRAAAESDLREGEFAEGATKFEVELTTLDGEFAAQASTIDFVKLDAGGAELRVLAGARRLLDRTDPLVMCELRHGPKGHEPFLRELVTRGFALYRLAPGPGVLVPLRERDETDRFILNVFACRPSMAAKLAACGRLEFEAHQELAPSAARSATWWRTLPFSAAWDALRTSEDWAAMDDWWAATLESPADHRAARLRRAFDSWIRAGEAGDPWAFQSAARAATALGYRERAAQLLRRALESLGHSGFPRPKAPFLPASARFERIEPAPEKTAEWAIACVADELDRLEHPCGFFQPAELNELQRLVMTHGFADEALTRRVTLVRRRVLARDAAAKAIVTPAA